MTRTDQIMRRVWVSPWTALVGLLVFAAFAPLLHGWDARINTGAGIYCVLVFLHRGRKRWGPS